MTTLGALSRAVLASALAVLVATTAACGSKTPTTASSADDSVAKSSPGLGAQCGVNDTGVEKLVITAADGINIIGARFGSGDHGVVLLPQLGNDLCSYWSYGKELSGQNYNVLAISYRNTGYSDEAKWDDKTADAIAAVRALRKAGAKKVVLIGASIGAATTMITGGRFPSELDGLITLSLPPGDLDMTNGAGDDPHVPSEAAPLITAPLLMCWSQGDDSAIDPQHTIDLATKTTNKAIITKTGGFHGQAMLSGPDDVRPDIITFLKKFD